MSGHNDLRILCRGNELSDENDDAPPGLHGWEINGVDQPQTRLTQFCFDNGGFPPRDETRFPQAPCCEWYFDKFAMYHVNDDPTGRHWGAVADYSSDSYNPDDYDSHGNPRDIDSDSDNEDQQKLSAVVAAAVAEDGGEQNG